MYIYIDEAGNFAQPSSPDSRYDLIAALVIPEAVHDAVVNRFVALRESWNGGTGKEVKGSKLTADQARTVIQLLAEHDATLEFVTLDMAHHSPATIAELQRITADGIIEHVPQDNSHLAKQMHELREHVLGLSNQLFVQLFLTVELILETLQQATTYYVQRRPRELGAFRWVIDSKERTLTEMEELWGNLVMPYGQDRFVRNSLRLIEGEDYSHFGRFNVDATDPKKRRNLEFIERTYGKKPKGRAFDLKLVLKEHRVFADSASNPGVQIVDSIATTLRRALNNRLEEHGWDQIGTLIVKRPGVRIVQIGNQPQGWLEGPALETWRKIHRHTKPHNYDAPLIKAERNDPCPCKSGKKYKRCCGV